MALTTSSFLTLVDPVTGATRVLNVSAYHENEYLWLGGRERAYDGTMLIGEHNPRWSATATLEFMTGAEVESFELFIASEWDTQRIRPLSLRAVNMFHAGSNGNMQRAVGFAVYVHITGKSPEQYILPGSPNQTLTTRWSVDVLLEESN